jgi:replication fork clamp-binding protein CrfC
LRFSATQCHDEQANLFINSLFVLEREIKAIVTAEINLAKKVFQVHRVDASRQNRTPYVR